MLEHLFAGMKLRQGIWRTDAVHDLSYPHDGNETCYQVEDKSFWFKHRNEIILTIFDHHVSKDSLVLDVGGGNGFVTMGLQNAGYQTIFLEPFEDGCMNAKLRSVKNIVHGSMVDASFPDESFDAVGLFDVLEHIEVRQPFLMEINRILKPGGKLILSVPAFNHLWSEEDIRAGHFLRYTSSTLLRELEQSQFQNLFHSYMFSLLTGPVLLFRSLPQKFKFKSRRSAKDDHLKGPWLNTLLAFEKSRIKQQKRITYGSSLIAVFQKDEAE